MSISVVTESCKSSRINGNSSLRVTLATPDSITLTVHALDLTEDMSSISSKNDEVVVLFYELMDSITQIKLRFMGSFVLTKQNNKRRLAWANAESLEGKVFSVMVIERDTEDTNTQIESVVTSKFYEIKDHFEKQGNFKIEKYLSDNDIIGIKTFRDFDKMEKLDFEFSGFFKLEI